MNMSRFDYWKSVATVMVGATGAQALPLLAAPLLTRLCTPADMGAFSIWLGVIAIASIAATMRFDAAMVVDHERKQQSLSSGSLPMSRPCWPWR